MPKQPKRWSIKTVIQYLSPCFQDIWSKRVRLVANLTEVSIPSAVFWFVWLGRKARNLLIVIAPSLYFPSQRRPAIQIQLRSNLSCDEDKKTKIVWTDERVTGLSILVSSLDVVFGIGLFQGLAQACFSPPWPGNSKMRMTSGFGSVLVSSFFAVGPQRPILSWGGWSLVQGWWQRRHEAYPYTITNTLSASRDTPVFVIIM